MAPNLDEDATDYHTLNDGKNKIILQTLLDNVEDEEVKRVLACFTIEARGAEIIKKMTQLTLPPLKKAAIYLEIPESNAKTKLKAEIISDIVDRLNALLMEICGICGEYYHEDLDEKPLTKCIICKQGCHNKCQDPILAHFNVLDENQKKCRPFMCASCIGDYTEDTDEIIVNAPKSKKSPTKQKQKLITHAPTETNDVEGADGDQFEDASDTTGPPRTLEGVIAVNADGTDHIEAIAEEQTESNTDDRSKVPVCPNYKWGKCPNYESCQYRHPPRCWRWLEKGKCSYNNKCKYHHPPLCYNSLWSGECYNLDCKFFHLLKTHRIKQEEEQLKNSLNAGNFQSQFPQIQQPSNTNQSHPSHINLYQPSHINFQQPSHVNLPQTSHVNMHQSQVNQQHQINAPQTQMNQHSHIPSYQPQGPRQLQQTHTVASRQVHQPVQSAPPQPQNQTRNSPPHSTTQPRLNKEDLSFLVRTIKDILKEDLGKEIEEIKQRLNPSVPLQATNTQIQNPNLYSLQVVPRQHSLQ